MAETHLVLTGDTRRFGNRVTLSDGTEVDTTPPEIFCDSHDQAVEVAHLISLAHVKHGHPDDVDIVKGEPVQRKFVYDDSLYQKHAKRKKG